MKSKKCNSRCNCNIRRAGRLLALVLAAVMAFSLGKGVRAEEVTGSITLSDKKKDKNGNIVYEAYRIFDMTTDGQTDDNDKFSTVAYTVNTAWEAFFRDITAAGGAQYLVAEDTDPASLDPISFDGASKYINITQSNIQAFAKKAFEYSQKNNIAPAISNNTTGVFNDLPLGYYMIYPKGATIRKGDYTSIVSLTSTEPDAIVEQKAEYPSITKTADDQSVELGQQVTWTIRGKVPDITGFTDYEYVIKDKPSAGLTFDGKDKMTVTVGGEDVKSDCTIETGDEGISVSIPMTGKTYNADIVITYKTTVNSAAVSKISENAATLTYSNDPKDSTVKTTTPKVVDKVFSSKITIDKFGKEREKLEGVKFILQCASVSETAGNGTKPTATANYYYKTVNGKVTWVANKDDAEVFTTNSSGAAVIQGLENGEYDLIETETLPGYNKLAAPVRVRVNGDDSNESNLSYKKSIENKTGSLLPSTGGIGTTIFHIVGGSLLLAAVVLLVSRYIAQTE